MGEIQFMVLSVGMVSMVWRIIDKYWSIYEKVHKYLTEKFNVPSTICQMCVTFWLHLIFFIGVGDPIGMSFIKALGCTPFTLELTKSIWQ